MMPEGWEWDETLYAGSAEYYEHGRLPYPDELADRLASALNLDGSGRPIDVGCGPGIIAFRLVHLFEEVVGVDADRHMLEPAAQRAAEREITDTRWVACTPRTSRVTLVPFGSPPSGSHFTGWIDHVLPSMFWLLEPGGAFVLVNHWSLAGEAAPDSYPLPPDDGVQELIRSYLGETPRAGQGLPSRHARRRIRGATCCRLRRAGAGPAARRGGRHHVGRRPGRPVLLGIGFGAAPVRFARDEFKRELGALLRPRRNRECLRTESATPNS